MDFKQERAKAQTKHPPTGFLHIALYLIACAGYLFNLFGTAHRTLAGPLLLTLMYGVWLIIFHLERLSKGKRGFPRLLVLFCLAVAAPLLAFLGESVAWLWILPVLTASLMAALKPRALGLGAVAILWLSSSLTFTFITHNEDISSQVLLLLTFVFTFGFAATVRQLAQAHTRMQGLINELEGSNSKLEAAHKQLLEYTIRAEDISAMRERNRIAREIHDTLGHSLTLLAVQLETATQLEIRGDPGLHEELVEARRVTKECLADVRHSVEALRPDATTEASFEEALRQLVASYTMRSPQTVVTLDLEEVNHSLSQEQRQTLYRCMQEALTNIRKHAQATKVLLRLSTNEQQAELTVLDNGQGSAAAAESQKAGFGLRGMRERVALLGGEFKAGPEAEHGWRVEIVLPREPQAKASALYAGEMGERAEL
ncbi:sensor histidine kinase [Ktedonosporobacter rubrisoli]|uniref:histidine kinase n=1 Tax=Ktedonosporobacter rubrisoli TaxID=2509675 RepID=A0A4P6JK30_KTERU|nr:sensor histidine kinase [Ktedonosporobacter rubrisoli]QBD75403.1 sensor histidine kinase [Ktedonosporobacter rubrisoli]